MTTSTSSTSSTSFTSLGVPDAIATALHDQGFDAPFAIQTTALPDALAGRDVSGCAPTGSGKTLAFAIPVAARVDAARPGRPRALLFSATLDGDVDVLVRRYQQDPVRHEVAAERDDTGDVRHLFWPVTRQGRRPLATEALHAHSGSAIVFCRTKRGADRLAKQLRKSGIDTASIHGDRSQNQRERALASFTDGTVTTLVATDVAARGIHVDDVELVLHYDLPATEKDYVHRSGRTGRAGADGLVVSLVFEDQHDDLHAIQRHLALPTGLDRGEVGELSAGGGSPRDDQHEPRGRDRHETRGGDRQEPRGGARPRSRRRSRR